MVGPFLIERQDRLGLGKMIILENLAIRHTDNMYYRRYTSDPILNGIPYGKTGYRRSATLYHIEVLMNICPLLAYEMNES